MPSNHNSATQDTKIEMANVNLKAKCCTVPFEVVVVDRLISYLRRALFLSRYILRS